MARREGLPLLKEADAGILGQHLQLQSGHDTAGDTTSETQLSQQWTNLDSLDDITAPKGVILRAEPKVTVCTEKKIGKTVKRNRTSTDWREEKRPKIASCCTELKRTEKFNMNLEIELHHLLAFLMGTLSMILDTEKILALVEQGKGELTAARNALIRVVAQEKMKKEKTKMRKNEKKRKKSNNTSAKRAGGEAEEQEVLDLGVALENTICTSEYLSKLETYVNCQKTWMTTLQTNISILEAGTTKAAQNQEILRRLDARHETLETLNVLTAPNFSGLPYKNDEQVFIFMNEILNFLFIFFERLMNKSTKRLKKNCSQLSGISRRLQKLTR